MKQSIVLTFGVGLMAAGCGGPQMRPGTTAPDFSLTTLDGRKVSLSDYRGKPVLLVFWAVG
jgi:cytochrome oxidase Cu insertion factor (SCO1/SenC/PrrC family)